MLKINIERFCSNALLKDKSTHAHRHIITWTLTFTWQYLLCVTNYRNSTALCPLLNILKDNKYKAVTSSWTLVALNRGVEVLQVKKWGNNLFPVLSGSDGGSSRGLKHHKWVCSFTTENVASGLHQEIQTAPFRTLEYLHPFVFFFFFLPNLLWL